MVRELRLVVEFYFTYMKWCNASLASDLMKERKQIWVLLFAISGVSPKREWCEAWETSGGIPTYPLYLSSFLLPTPHRSSVCITYMLWLLLFSNWPTVHDIYSSTWGPRDRSLGICVVLRCQHHSTKSVLAIHEFSFLNYLAPHQLALFPLVQIWLGGHIIGLVICSCNQANVYQCRFRVALDSWEASRVLNVWILEILFVS